MHSSDSLRQLLVAGISGWLYFRTTDCSRKRVAYYGWDTLSRLAHVPNWSGHDPREEAN